MRDSRPDLRDQPAVPGSSWSPSAGEEWLAEAIAFAEVLTALKFPKGTILKGAEVHMPGKPVFRIVMAPTPILKDPSE